MASSSGSSLSSLCNLQHLERSPNQFRDLVLLLPPLELGVGPWSKPGVLCVLGCLPLRFLLLYLCILEGTVEGLWGLRSWKSDSCRVT